MDIRIGIVFALIALAFLMAAPGYASAQGGACAFTLRGQVSGAGGHVDLYGTAVGGGGVSGTSNTSASITVACGSMVSIDAVPNQGYYDSGWTCSGPGCYHGYGQGTADSWSFNLTGDVTETMSFQTTSTTVSTTTSTSTTTVMPRQCFVSVQVNGTGTARMYNNSASGNYTGYGIMQFPCNGQMYIYATGNYFRGWTCRGTSCYSGPQATALIHVYNNITEIATFSAVMCSLKGVASGSGNIYLSGQSAYGSPIRYSTSSNTTLSVPCNTTVEVNATPQYGYAFNYWNCSGNCYSGISPTGSFVLKGNYTEVANFSAVTENSTSSGVQAGSSNKSKGAGSAAASQGGFSTIDILLIFLAAIVAIIVVSWLRKR